MTYRTLRTSVALGVLALGLTGFGATARAQSVTIDPSSGVGSSAFIGASYVNFDEITPIPTNPDGSKGPLVSPTSADVTGGGTIGLVLTPDGGAVQGASNGLFAPPYLSGNNNLFFGPITTGADATTYLTSGGAGGSVTLSFGAQETYFGVLWGSIDTYNSLIFSNSITQQSVTLTGSQITNPANGAQGLSGTAYVNVTADGAFTFNSVTLTSSQHAFEVDNVAFGNSSNPNLGAVPEPASLVMFGTAFLVVSGVTWNRNRKAKAVPQS